MNEAIMGCTMAVPVLLCFVLPRKDLRMIIGVLVAAFTVLGFAFHAPVKMCFAITFGLTLGYVIAELIIEIFNLKHE